MTKFYKSTTGTATIKKPILTEGDIGYTTAPGDNLTVKLKDNNQEWKIPNPLHKFATYNTLFTLSGLTEAEIREPKNYLEKNAPHDIIARSGGIGERNRFSNAIDKRIEGVRDQGMVPHDRINFEAALSQVSEVDKSRRILERNRDIFFENVNILSTVAPNESRNSMNFTRMEFELHEPYGVTFVEKVRAAAFNCGFLDYADAPFLLTIEWKGFDEHSRPIKTEDSLIRKIPILLSRVEFTVNEGGAVYTIIAVPYNDFALMDRYNKPRSDGNIKAKYLTRNQGRGTSTEDSSYWDEQVIALLNDDMEEEKRLGLRKYPDRYEIKFDPEILKQGFKKSYSLDTVIPKTPNRFNRTSSASKFNKAVEFGGASSKISSKIHLSKSIEDAVRSLPFYKELTVNFWEIYFSRIVNPETFTTAGPAGKHTINDIGAKDKSKWFDPENSKELAKVLAMNPMIPWFKVISTVYTEAVLDPITKMHPKTIKFKIVPYNIHILKLATAGVSFGDVDWGRYVRKHFNYIYTGENVDVQNLRIEYKVGYWMKNVREAPPEGVLKKIKAKVNQRFEKLFGKELEKAMLELRQYPSLEKPDSSSGSEDEIGAREDQFWDYLTNPQADMMRIELEILGDPGFLSQDMYTTLAQGDDINSARGDGDWNDFHNCFNVDSVMPTIGVNYKMPGDIDLQKGLMFPPTQTEIESNIFFNGVYQVNKVESRVNNGQFTQILYCTRLNQQTGKGDAPGKNWIYNQTVKEFGIETKTDDAVESNKDSVEKGVYY